MATLITSITGDVTYDGIPDTLFLTGTQVPDSAAWQQLQLVVQDGRSCMTVSLPLPDEIAYSPTLTLTSLTGAGKKDILVALPTGGSGGIMNAVVYAYLEDQFQQVFSSQDYQDLYQYDVFYLDGYTVKAYSRQNRREYLIDISDRGSDYLTAIYNQDGTLKEPITGFVNPLSGLFPVDFSGNGQSSLLAYQKIAGQYNADALGYFLNTLTWQENAFVLTDQMAGILGADANVIQPRT